MADAVLTKIAEISVNRKPKRPPSHGRLGFLHDGAAGSLICLACPNT